MTSHTNQNFRIAFDIYFLIIYVYTFLLTSVPCLDGLTYKLIEDRLPADFNVASHNSQNIWLDNYLLKKKPNERIDIMAYLYCKYECRYYHMETFIFLLYGDLLKDVLGTMN